MGTTVDDYDPMEASQRLGPRTSANPPAAPADYDPMEASQRLKPILSTSYPNGVPTRERPNPDAWGAVPQDEAPARIRAAATEAFRNAPSLGQEPGNMSLLSTGAQDWLTRNLGPVGSAINTPFQLAGTAVGGLAAAGSGAIQTARELLQAGGLMPSESVQRNLFSLAQSLPALSGEMAAIKAAGAPRLEAPGPRYAGGVTPESLQTAADRSLSRRGLLDIPGERPVTIPDGAPPTGPVSPTGIGGPQAPPYTPPTTPELGKAIAQLHYDAFNKAAEAAGAQTQQFTNKFIDSVDAAAGPPGIERAARGPTAVTALLDRLQPYRDQPMTLTNAHAIDKTLSELITSEYDPAKGVSDVGRQLQQVQRDFRDQITNPSAGDVTGGQSGLDALTDARKAWSQSRKMDDLDRIRERAMMTQDPTSSIKSQVRNLLTNESKSRGYTDEETAALKDAADRGFLGTATRVFGSRLIPPIAGAVGFGTTGPIGGAIAAGGAEATGSAFRAWQNSLAQARLAKAMEVLGKTVPAPPPPRNPFNVPP